MTRFWTVFVASVLVMWGGGCANKAVVEEPPKKGEIQDIYIITPTAWWIRISGDGSARYGYGASSEQYVQLRPGSFSPQGVLADIEPLLTEEGDMTDDYAVIVRRVGDGAVNTRYMTSSKPVGPMFERARRRAAPTPELAEMWARRAPVPVD